MTLTEISNKTFANLEKLKPGTRAEIAKSEIAIKFGIEVAVDTCKLFIDAGNYDFELTDDYKFIKRLSHKF